MTEIVTRKQAKALGLTRYSPGSTCLRGHVAERWTNSGKCTACHYEDNPLLPKDRFMTPEEAKEAAKEAKRRHYLRNKEEVKRKAAQWKMENPRKVREGESKWRQKPSSKSITFMRDSLRRVLKLEKNGRTEKILGYTRAELTTHIEKQFTKGMSWDNHGVWHIDHIVSISQFIKEGVTDPKIINALSNLKPIWAKDNLKKNAKLESLL